MNSIQLGLSQVLELPVRYRSVLRAVRETAEAASDLLSDRFVVICDKDGNVIARAGSPSMLAYLTNHLVTPGFRWNELPRDPAGDVRLGDLWAGGHAIEMNDEPLTAFVGAQGTGRREDAAWMGTTTILLECLRSKIRWYEHEQTRQHFTAEKAKLETFHSLTSELSELQSPDAILATVVHRVTELMDAGTTIVYGLNPSGTKLVPLAGHKIPAEDLRMVRSEIEIGPNFVAEAFTTGRIRFCDDLENPEGTGTVLSLQEFGLKSVLVVPIRSADHPLGVMLVGRYLNRPFDTSRAEVLAFTARQIALILDNARLQAQLTHRLQGIDKELTLAKDVQALMLPRTPLEAGGFRVMGRSWAAKAVGGDYFDYLVTGNQLNIVVADIMGKGVSAALLMSILRSHVRTVWESEPGLTAESVALLSRMVCRDFQPHRSFVTVLLMNIDLAARELSVFLAGHHAPLFVRQDRLIEPFTRRAPVMGLTEQAPSADLILRMPLQEGDTLLGFTDGVPDTIGEGRTRFGTERLKASLTAVCQQLSEPAEIADAVADEIKRFTVEQPDDTTLCVLRVGN